MYYSFQLIGHPNSGKTYTRLHSLPPFIHKNPIQCEHDKYSTKIQYSTDCFYLTERPRQVDMIVGTVYIISYDRLKEEDMEWLLYGSGVRALLINRIPAGTSPDELVPIHIMWEQHYEQYPIFYWFEGDNPDLILESLWVTMQQQVDEQME